MAPSGLLSLPTPFTAAFVADSRACSVRAAEDKRSVRFERQLGLRSRNKSLECDKEWNSNLTVIGVVLRCLRGFLDVKKLACGAPARKLRACTVLEEREPGYGPLLSSSSSTNQVSDNGEEELDKAKRPPDSSELGNEVKPLMSEEERLAEEQSRRRLEELTRQAMEEARIKKEAEFLFQMSQRAYGRGVYDKSVDMLEAALTKVPGASNLGGEIQIWLAMAYDAVGRHAECIALYKRLEGSHPNKILRKQAADLRYILEAPKLKISRDEMVKIPLIEKDYDRKAKTWSQMVKEKRRKPLKKSAQSRDYLSDWLVWKPPRWEKSPYFWVALTIWLTLVGVSVFQN